MKKYMLLALTGFIINTCFAQYDLLDRNPTKVDVATKVRQCMVIGYHGSSAEDATVQTLENDIYENGIGGVIHYAYNITSMPQIHSLNAHLRECSTKAPLLIGIDNEGGIVQRFVNRETKEPIPGFESFKSAQRVGEKLSYADAQTLYTAMANQTAKMGCNWSFGPVVDVNPKDRTCPVIGGLERSFGSDPVEVTQFATSFVQGHRAKKVLTCIKHWPGHGFAKGDTHKGVTNVTDVWNREIETAPYKAMIGKGAVDSIMTSHIYHTVIDPDYPASLSPVFVEQMLRGDFGYDGLVVTDDLCMGAILEQFNVPHTDADESTYLTLGKVGVQALKAGSDMIMYSRNNAASGGRNVDLENLVARVVEAVETAIQNGELKEERLNEAFSRVMAFKRKLGH